MHCHECHDTIRINGRVAWCRGALRDLLLGAGLASEEDLKAIDKDIRDVVSDSADFAQNDPEPDVSELYTDILL